MLNKILVAIDLCNPNKTFDAALSLAQIAGAKLMLLNVIAPDENNYPNPFVYSSYEYGLMNESLLAVYQEQWDLFKQRGLKILRSLVEEAAAVGVEAESIQEFGNPGCTICELAQTYSTDLIIVGSRGLTGVREMFLGSVSNYVTHHAPCSVLILRETKNSQLSATQPISTASIS